ncbi:hypothetical protein AWV79_00295 [Cupriavidus sp. UYMMa02A]|nr:hypothetical protein AWV79_00295 [Cupriavidus sp. UYMMa02A]
MFAPSIADIRPRAARREEVAEGTVEAGLVIPRDHVARIGHVADQHARQQRADFLDVLGAHHVATAGGHQQRRHGHVRQVYVDIVFMEAVEARQDGALVARVQPFGTQA